MLTPGQKREAAEQTSGLVRGKSPKTDRSPNAAAFIGAIPFTPSEHKTRDAAASSTNTQGAHDHLPTAPPAGHPQSINQALRAPAIVGTTSHGAKVSTNMPAQAIRGRTTLSINIRHIGTQGQSHIQQHKAMTAGGHK